MEKTEKFRMTFWLYIAVFFMAWAALGAMNKYFISGEHAFGTTPDVAWGSLIAGYVFFAVAATGTGLVASLGHVFRIKKFDMLAKRALLASILLLISAFAVLAIELSNPFKMIWMLFTPNFSSPIFWMGAFYGAYLILLFAEFYFTLKDNHRVATGIAYVSFVVKLAAIINLGKLFSFAIAREFWTGYYYPIYMVISAVVSGAAVLTMIVYLKGRDSAKFDYLGKNISQTLGKILAGALIFLAVMQAVKIGVSLGSGNVALVEAAKAVVAGPMAYSFWLMEILIGLVLPLVILFYSRFTSSGKAFIASFLAILGLLFSRLNFVYAGQVVPLQVVPEWSSAGTFNAYSTTWSEWSLIIGALGFVIFLFSLAENKLMLDSKT